MRARARWVLTTLAGAALLSGCGDSFFYEPADGPSVPVSFSYSLAPEFANLATPLQDFQSANQADVLIEAPGRTLFDGRVSLSQASNGTDKEAEVRVQVGENESVAATATVQLLVNGSPVLQGTGNLIISAGGTGVHGVYSVRSVDGVAVSLPQVFPDELGPGCDVRFTSFTVTLSPSGSWIAQATGEQIDRTGETAGCGGAYDETLAAGPTFQQNGTTLILTAFDGSTISATLSGGLLTITDPDDNTVYVFEKPSGGTASVEIFLEPVSGGGGGTGAINGTVVDAFDQSPIANATVQLLPGRDATGGSPVASATTGSSGQFSLANLAAGDYTLVISASGFIQVRRNATLGPGGTLTVTVAMSQQLGTGQTRIVLTWGSSPSDLDAYLTGPDGSGGSFVVYYGTPGAQSTSPFATLDTDVTTGFGPETVTIWQQLSGTYCYSVHNFSGSPGISTSGATVEVFQGGSRVASYPVPQGTGLVWTVFRLDGSGITPINRIDDQGPPGVCQ